MCNSGYVYFRPCADCCTFADRLNAVLEAEGVAVTADSVCEAKAALISVPTNGMIAACTVADIMSAVSAGVPVIPVCEETVDEAVAKIKALVAEPDCEAVAEEESVAEEQVEEVPVVDEPVIEEHAAELPVVEPVIESPIVETSVNEALKCGTCGTEIIPGTKFCYGCGAKIEPKREEEIALAKEEEMVCSGCGTKLPLNTKFCFKCGKKIEGEPAVKEDVKPVCSVCGEAIIEGTMFCFKCGNKHGAAPSKPAAPVTPKCPGCGADIIPGDKFCFACGRPL